MDDAERIALKAACVQAAAILLAALRSTTPSVGEPDTEKCARYALDLYAKLTLETWQRPQNHQVDP
jgi:hypothetical protein